MKKIILHIDMNSYFASVEQQANPFLRGRSVGVCAYLSPGGTIIASSAEAKAKGIKTGMRVADAKLLDPDLVLVENEPAKYRSTTEKIFGILREYASEVEPYSIDEAFLDLSGWVKDFGEAESLALRIKARIKSEVGEWLEASVGISWTKFLSKFAGDIAPKRSVLVIDSKEKLCETLLDRPLQDAWGINVRMEARLNALGIRNLLELKNFPADRIRHALGTYGYYLWANVNGIEIGAVGQGSPEAKSIGHSYCIPKKTKDKKYLRTVLCKLCEKSGRRLRASGREAQGMNICLAYTHGGGVGKSWKLADKIFTSAEIFELADAYLEKTFLIYPVRMVAVSLTRLTPLVSQLSLFDDRVGRKELSRAVDKINDKYGEFTVVSGTMFGTDNIARDRIGFRKLD